MNDEKSMKNETVIPAEDVFGVDTFEPKEDSQPREFDRPALESIHTQYSILYG